MEDPLRQRLVAFYAKHNPVRLQTIDSIIESWRDDESGLFEALREKYDLDEAFQPKGSVRGLSADDAHAGDSVESVPANLTPLQQMEYRCQKMERYLTELFVAPCDAAHEGTTANFRETAAAFSEICLGILRDAKATHSELEARERNIREDASDQQRSTQSAFAPGSGEIRHIIQASEAPSAGDDLEPLIHDVMPLDVDAVADRVLSTVIRTKCKNGDILNIHPGIYRDNITVGGLHLQLRAASALKDRPVVIVAADATIPILQVKDRSVVSLQGLDFTATTERSAPSVPLITLDTASAVMADDCAFVGGGGGLMAGDAETRLEMNSCSLRDCAFAGIYVKGGARSSVRHCKMLQCEVGVRVRDAIVEIDASECINSTSDGVTFHGSCRGVISRAVLSDSKENGAMLSPSSVVSFQACELNRNGQFGLYVPAGSEYVADGCSFSGNSMGAYNRPPPISSQLHAISRRHD